MTTTTYVYFARFGNACKIGISKTPVQRLQALKWSMPPSVQAKQGEMLALKSFGSRRKAGRAEDRLHKQFGTHCIGGEWFQLSPEIINYCRKVGVCDHPAECQVGITSLKVLIPIALDQRIEIRVAQIRITKREWVEAALRSALESGTA